ncbi:hypothetical protein [Pseudomonas sp. UMAB-40]|uniref:hypothetical protein n=1 Tax=Pseudomonas sp. UMAB-40 TaxID=1365407 RepID=UPI001C57F4B9|nr:hypothetical protein [Pseudomonas sp. UMAB-40]
MVYQVTIEITGVSGVMPTPVDASLRHGPVNGNAQFKIKSGLRPTALQLAHLLSLHCDEWCLTHYDHVSGYGEFITVDFDPPTQGSQIQLECFTDWPRTTTLVFERS